MDDEDLSIISMLCHFKVGGILISCQYFYHPSADIPVIFFFSVVIIAEVLTRLFFYVV